jgi:hypothetical protein
MQEISELNKTLNNKIKSKLIKNEDHLLNLEKQILLLKKDNQTLIEKNSKNKKIINKYKEQYKKLKINLNEYNSNDVIKNVNNYNNNINNNCFIRYKTNINNIKNKRNNKNIHCITTNNDHYIDDIIDDINNKKIKKNISENKIKYANSVKNTINYQYNLKRQ